MIEIRRILCPVDFSDQSRRALDHAIAIARLYGAEVTVLHVFSPAAMTPVGAAPVVFEPMVLVPVAREQLAADIEAFVAAGARPVSRSPRCCGRGIRSAKFSTRRRA